MSQNCIPVESCQAAQGICTSSCATGCICYTAQQAQQQPSPSLALAAFDFNQMFQFMMIMMMFAIMASVFKRD